jgi:urease accessory protein
MSTDLPKTTAISIQAAVGRCRLGVTAGALVPRVIEQTGSSARVALVAGGALLLGGDRVAIAVTVGAGCLLEIDDIGGTVAYDADDELSSWSVTIRIESGGVLIWHGLPLVVSTGSNVSRSLQAELEPAAIICLRETIVLGRDSEVGGALDTRTNIRSSGRELLVEHLELTGSHPDPGVLGSHRVLDSIVLVGRDAPDVPEQSLLLDLEDPGCIVRSILDDTHLSELDQTFYRWRDLLVADHRRATAKLVSLALVA